ncbi:MAG: type II secretion system protein GspE, partial [Planctomycetes bacterium]|nr:type II secretion system protein GspE [Planctomycetota bacterium]
LLRRICLQCRQPYTPADRDCRLWAATGGKKSLPKQLFKGQGCPACLQTGYHERIGIFEFLTVNEPIREAVLQRARASGIKALAMTDGMTTLRADGIAKATEGVTTTEEVLRVTGRDEF